MKALTAFRLAMTFLLLASPMASLAQQPQPSLLAASSASSGPGAKSDGKSASAASIADPLLRLLVDKGMISADEARALDGASDGRDRLAALLRDKGILTDAEYRAIRSASSPTSVATAAMTSAAGVTPPTAAAQAAPSGQTTPQNPAAQQSGTTPQTPRPPAVIPAVAPLRVLQLEGVKRDSIFPAIKLGSNAKLSPYGFFKASVVHDSSSPGGNDFPLPGFLGDTGPGRSPEFHLKARAFRLGANFEWLDPSPKVVVTGRVEFDFEGDFTRVNNRNISSIRSSQPSLRLAWMRIDRTLSDRSAFFALFGQDWTPFGSSTLPNLVETTGYGIGFGTLYERLPQVRVGFNRKLGGTRNFSFQPEFAIALPAYGNLPADVVIGGAVVPNREGIGNQLAYGERQGADSQRPEIQGRFVLQFQLDRAPGVAPAQLIASFMQGARRAIVTRGDLVAAVSASSLSAADKVTIINAFPTGVEASSSRYGYTLEAQLPTRFVTLLGKFYSGQDLRFYFAGQLFSFFNDTAGMTSTVSVPSIDGSAAVVLGLRGGQPVVAPQRPVRAAGGFVNLGFPLSRIFGADPRGRNAGWVFYLHYSYDQGFARDIRRINPANRGKSDLFAATLQYRLNTWVSFIYEQSLYRTRAVNNAGPLPLFRGIPSREWHNVRSEFATVFTF